MDDNIILHQEVPYQHRWHLTLVPILVRLHTIHSSLGPSSLRPGGEFGDPGHP
jgi:hypothetical protein